MEKKVKPLVLNFDTAQSQAEYYFKREFDSTSLELVKNEEGLFDIIQPNIKYIIKEWFENYQNFNDVLIDFLDGQEETEINIENFTEFEDFIDFVENHNEYDKYLSGDHQNNHYPMWGYVFKCNDFYISSDYMNTDMLYEIGIGVLEADDDYFLFIAGAGYDFYEAHWIPLFEKIGWIKYEENEKISN